MIRVYYAKKFLKQVKSLPIAQQKKLTQQIELLRQDPTDSRLHSKRLQGEMRNLLSFRITRDWRVTFRFFESSSVEIVEVEHRKDIYRRYPWPMINTRLTQHEEFAGKSCCFN